MLRLDPDGARALEQHTPHEWSPWMVRFGRSRAGPKYVMPVFIRIPFGALVGTGPDALEARSVLVGLFPEAGRRQASMKVCDTGPSWSGRGRPIGIGPSCPWNSLSKSRSCSHFLKNGSTWS